MLAIVVLLPSPLAPVTSIRPARSSNNFSVFENFPRILDRRPQKGCAGNWPQSRLTHSTHFHESGRYHRPAMRSQAATHFPASPVVPPSRNQSPASLYPPGTADLPPAVG